MNAKPFLRIFSASILILSLNAVAQSTDSISQQDQKSYMPFRLSSDLSKKGFFNLDAEWFGSVGFNKTRYHESDINVNQPSQGNNFTVHDIQGHDEYKTPGFRSPDNFRIGRFIDDQRKWAVELSHDHDKFTSTLGQTASVTGVVSNSTSLAPTNSHLGIGTNQLNTTTFSYMLHNGLNSTMINLIYRKPLIGEIADESSLSFIGKIGTGLAIVHPYNTIDGQDATVGEKTFSNVIGFNSGWWRIVGTSTGVEAGFRYVVKKPIYLEFTNKQMYTEMNNIPVSSGNASQKLWSNQYILSLGYEFGGK